NGAGELLGHARQCTGRGALRYPAAVRVRQIALIGLLALGSACRGRGSPDTAQEQHELEAAELPSAQVEDAGPPSWGPPVPGAATSELLASELARRGSDARLLAALEGPERERALWS